MTKRVEKDKDRPSELERLMNDYKFVHNATNDFFCDVLGRDKPLDYRTFVRKRSGKSEFTAREAAILADLFGKSLADMYELLPAINR